MVLKCRSRREEAHIYNADETEPPYVGSYRFLNQACLTPVSSRVLLRSAVQLPVNRQQFTHGHFRARWQFAAHDRQQPGRLFAQVAVAVETVAGVVDKFHRQKPIEPLEEPLAKRGLARCIPSN